MTDGKLTSKPADLLRKKLARRAKEQMQLVREMNSKDAATLYGVKNKPSPSQKRSEAWKKKMRIRDGRNIIPDDYPIPQPVTGTYTDPETGEMEDDVEDAV